MYSDILYEAKDPIATITLNRPDRLNAYTSLMGDEIRHAIEKAEKDPDIVTIIITGAGRGFCAGADLGGLKRRHHEGVPSSSSVHAFSPKADHCCN